MDAIPYEENSFYIFGRGYNDFKHLHNIHSIGAYFVVRGKKNNDFKPMKWRRRPKDSGILSDADGYMNGKQTGQNYRSAASYAGTERTNESLFSLPTLTIAELYHQRWNIELFFKWLKQHLKIKKFWGTSENAVRIQIYSEITAYCMMAIVQKKDGDQEVYLRDASDHKCLTNRHYVSTKSFRFT